MYNKKMKCDIIKYPIQVENWKQVEIFLLYWQILSTKIADKNILKPHFCSFETKASENCKIKCYKSATKVLSLI